MGGGGGEGGGIGGGSGVGGGVGVGGGGGRAKGGLHALGRPPTTESLLLTQRAAGVLCHRREFPPYPLILGCLTRRENYGNMWS